MTSSWSMVTRIATAAVIPRHISPHSLRHAAITNVNGQVVVPAGGQLKVPTPR